MNDALKSADLIGRLAQRIDLNADLFVEADASSRFPADVPDAALSDVTTMPPLSGTTATPVAQTELAPHILLDLGALRIQGYLTPLSYRPVLAEEYRIIKRPMLRSAFSNQREHDARDHITLITSPHPHDGKTFTAINLGMSMASEHGVQVLLIDSDVRQRGMSRALGVASHKGLMDVLMDKSISVADVILRTNIPNLSILPAGQSVEAPTELLASPRMHHVIGEITRRYVDRFVIIDSPPVLASSEPGVLAAYVGQVIIVVQANETTREAIKESIALVDACENINFVLNKVTLSAGSDRFGYSGFYEDS